MIKRICDICGADGAAAYDHYLYLEIHSKLFTSFFPTKHDFCPKCKEVVKSILWSLAQRCVDAVIGGCSSPLEALVLYGVTKERYEEAKANKPPEMKVV